MRAIYPYGRLFTQKTYNKAFTIVELLIVVVVLGILATIVISSLNPGEIMKRSRDVNRVSDVRTLNRVLLAYKSEGSTAFGSANTIYISLPDSNSNCSSYTLPTLPGGWNYSCKPLATYRNNDGTGWMPVDFTNNILKPSIAILPIDPANSITGRYYYSYIVNGDNWELNASMEAQSNIVGGTDDKTSTDGGDDPTKLEAGSDVTVAPWSFEFSAFPTVANNSGFPGWYQYTGTGVASIGSDGTAANYVEFNGYAWVSWQENIPFNPDSTYKMTCRMRQVTDPTTGGKAMYCGWTGVGSDGVTLVNMTGSNTYSSQHYQTMWGASLTAGAGWVSYTGYTKGWGSPNGTGGSCGNPATPCQMHQNVRYIKPMFIVNYLTGDGTVDIDSILFTKQ